MLLRYAAYPLFVMPPDRKGKVKIRYVISDPSTFLYFDSRRPVSDQNSRDNYQYMLNANNKVLSQRGDSMNGIICNNGKCDLNYANPNVAYNPSLLKPQKFAIPDPSWNVWQVCNTQSNLLYTTTILVLLLTYCILLLY